MRFAAGDYSASVTTPLVTVVLLTEKKRLPDMKIPFVFSGPQTPFQNTKPLIAIINL